MNCDELASEVASLKAQLNAVSQIALQAVAALEIHGLVEPESFARQARKTRWPGPLNAEARDTVDFLCRRLEGARLVRLHREAAPCQGSHNQ